MRRSARPRALGRHLVERFHADATVLSSQLVAQALFDSVRRRDERNDLGALLSALEAEWVLSEAELRAELAALHERARAVSASGRLQLSPAVAGGPPAAWLDDGLARLAELQGARLIERCGDGVAIRDPALLSYDRNRLSGYGLPGGDGRDGTA